MYLYPDYASDMQSSIELIILCIVVVFVWFVWNKFWVNR